MNTYTRRQAMAAAAIATCYRRLGAATLAQVRLGVTTDEIDEDVLTAAKFLREFGLQYAEVRSIWGKYNTSQPVAKVREARQVLDGEGIKTSVLGTAFFKIPLPPDTPEGRGTLDSQWALLDQSMERARILGTDKIRVFAFTRKEKGSEQPSDKDFQRIQDLVREAARRAKARNFRLALENVGGSYVSTGAEAARLLNAVKEDALGLTWDPNNAGA